MALNVAGVVVMVFFYLMVFGTGIWASFKSKKESKKSSADQMEMTLLGNRGINLVVGMFTMTGGSTFLSSLLRPGNTFYLEMLSEQNAEIDCG